MEQMRDEVTEDAVAETTYYIVVTEPEKSSGAQGQNKLTQWPTDFNDGKEGTTVSDYKLSEIQQQVIKFLQ